MLNKIRPCFEANKNLKEKIKACTKADQKIDLLRNTARSISRFLFSTCCLLTDKTRKNLREKPFHKCICPTPRLVPTEIECGVDQSPDTAGELCGPFMKPFLGCVSPPGNYLSPEHLWRNRDAGELNLRWAALFFISRCNTIAQVLRIWIRINSWDPTLSFYRKLSNILIYSVHSRKHWWKENKIQFFVCKFLRQVP